MTSYPDKLRVFYDSSEVGTAVVTERLPRKFFGRFVPGASFESARVAFEEVVQCKAQAEGKFQIDDVAWNRWVELTREMTRRIALPELLVRVEAFELDEDWGVEVTFADTVE